MIADSLIQRVERSLRKRLQGDLRGLLDRYAARAESDEAFVTLASRLLLVPRERQHWLAVWSLRLQQAGNPETAPAPLDGGPSPAEPSHDETTSVHGSTDLPADAPAQAAAPATDLQLTRLRNALADELGPLAFALLTRESARVSEASALRERLRALLDDDAQRARFMRKTEDL